MDIPQELTVIIANLKGIQALCEAPHWTPVRRWEIQKRAKESHETLTKIKAAVEKNEELMASTYQVAWEDGYKQGQADLKTQAANRPNPV